MYIKPLSTITDLLFIIDHSFTDDIQFQIHAPPDKTHELKNFMQLCISDVKSWATAHVFELNGNKMELMIVNSN